MPLKLNPTTCQLDMVMGPGTGTAMIMVTVDDNTAPGTNPVVPTVGGDITITGAAVAAHSVPIETHSRAANAFNIEVQVGSAVTGAPGNTTAAGLAQFDDTAFSVDANGYVTLAGGPGAAIDSNTGDDAVTVGPDGAGNFNWLGLAVANATHAKPIFFKDSATANAIDLDVQVATEVTGAPADMNDAGISSYNDTQFTVDANGYVALVGGANLPGTQTLTSDDPTIVGPDVSGNIDITGEAVANATNAKPVFVDAGTNALNIEVQVAAAITGAPADKNDAGVCSFDDTAFAVDANGYVTLAGGAGPAVDSFTTDVAGPVSPTAGGVIDVTGTSVFSDGTAANTLTLNVQATAETFLVGAGAGSTATELGPLTNGQLIIGSTGAAPVLGSITSADASVTITAGAGTIDLVVAAGDDAVLTITGDSGGALSPTAGDIIITGGPGITTSGSGSTLTINSVVFNDVAADTIFEDNGYFVTAAGTYTLPATRLQGEEIIFVCDTTGAVAVTAPGSELIRMGTLITSAGGTLTSTAIGDSLTLRYRVSTTTWFVVSSIGTWVVA